MSGVLDLTGPEFLLFYCWLTAGGLVVALFFRWFCRTPGDPPQNPVRLGFHQAAVLAGSSRGRVDAALAGMIYAGWIEVDVGIRRLRRVLTPPGVLADEFELSLCECCSESGTRLESLRDLGRDASKQIEAELRSRGLVTDFAHRQLATAVPVLVMGIVLVVGIAKLCVGISRGRPVEFLIIFVLINLGMTVVLLGRPVWRTRRGDAVLASMRSEAAALRTSVGAGNKSMDRADVAMAFALFGPRVVPAGDIQMKKFATILQPVQSGGGDGVIHSCGGGCGGGGGGGGGGGCGGCGGGGGH